MRGCSGIEGMLRELLREGGTRRWGRGCQDQRGSGDWGKRGIGGSGNSGIREKREFRDAEIRENREFMDWEKREFQAQGIQEFRN